MRQRIDLDELYAKALQLGQTLTDDAGPSQKLPNGCPFTLDALLDGDVASLEATASA